MRVELVTTVFDADEHVQEIMVLLRHFSEGRHFWVVEPLHVPAVESFLDRHVPTLAGTYKNLVRQGALRHAAYSTAASPAPLRILRETIKDHVADLDRPAVVMVENDAADGGFIKAIAAVFHDAQILTAIDNEWLVIDHGGGSDLFRRASEKHHRFRRLSRVATVLDSDRKLPSDPPNKHNEIEKLRADGVKVHVLRLREIENYIPNKILRRLPPQINATTKVDALSRLTKEQRGHYDMKQGFRNGVVPLDQQSLYDGVPSDIIDNLADGFGRKVIMTFLEHAVELADEDFRTDIGPDAPGELRAMLVMLHEIV